MHFMEVSKKKIKRERETTWYCDDIWWLEKKLKNNLNPGYSTILQYTFFKKKMQYI